MILLDTAQQFDGAVGLIHLLPDGDECGVEVGVPQTIHLELQLAYVAADGGHDLQQGLYAALAQLLSIYTQQPPWPWRRAPPSKPDDAMVVPI